MTRHFTTELWMVTSLFLICFQPMHSQSGHEDPFGGSLVPNLPRELVGPTMGYPINEAPSNGRPHIVSVIAPDTLVRPSTDFQIFEMRAIVTDPDSTEDVDSVWFYSRDINIPNHPFHLKYRDGTLWLDTFQINSQANLGTYRFAFYAKDKQGDISDSLVHTVVVTGVTSIEPVAETRPPGFKLAQNHPNPFNPTTTISYQLPVQSHVTLIIFDILGRDAATLVNIVEPPGYKSVQFDGNNLPGGFYFYRLQAGSYVETKKLILLK